MGAEIRWLHATTEEGLPAKARRLVTLARAGLPVPRGLVLAPDPAAVDHPATTEAVDALLEQGPVVVRSALALEDRSDASAAGLGRSRLDCTTLDEVREALREQVQQRDDPWLRRYRSRTSADAADRAIVQHQVPRRALLVIAIPDRGAPQIELHTAAGEALAQGRTPECSGALSRWDDPAREAATSLVQRALGLLPATEHGYDLEVVVDHDDAVHLVQARPLAAPLHPGWADFLAAIEAEGSRDQLRGVLTLDIEHNPAPLSPAHAWLMGWLRSQRPAAGDPTVLAGWLYVRTLPRDLGRRRSSSTARPPPPPAVQVVATLHEHTLPRARARLSAIEARLAAADAATIIDTFPAATEAFLAMIDAYVGELIPARTVARRAAGDALHPDPAAPLSTRGRDAFLDVLPATWDLASPSLADLGATPRRRALQLPTDEAAAATLLGEWDDHLFALGLAPLRAWFRAAGGLLGIDDEAFMLTAPEVLDSLRGAEPPRAVIAQRRARLRRQAALRPPLRIDEGHPVATGLRARLRGIPIGPSFTGVLAPRSDLAALLADPPGTDAIVTLPALTAPAAVALEQLGVRAVCCEHGGPLSHAALMARELGLSALIGCRDCTTLPAGLRARVDTTAGRLRLDPPDHEG